MGISWEKRGRANQLLRPMKLSVNGHSFTRSVQTRGAAMKRINLGSRKLVTLALALIAAAIGVASKWLLTSGELLPGIDGAYYWVQVRSVMTEFTLGFNDLPLVIWAQALIAWVVGDIPLGVRISDALLPAISAIPIYFLLRKSKSVFVPAIAILVVLLHPIQLYFFTGDFLKNSAAIPVVFFICWILYNWESAPRKRSIVYLLICLVVLGLAHFGTLLLGLMILGIWLIVHLRNASKRFWIYSLSITAGSLAAVLAGLAILVPSRFERLISFVTTPSTIFANPAVDMLFSGHGDYPMMFSIITGQLGAIVLGFWTWNARKNLSDSQLSLVLASLISAFMLSSPLIGMEWANRLVAMSFVPLLVAAMVIWMAYEKLPARITVGVLAASTLITTMVFSTMSLKQSMISETQYSDLIKFSKEYKLPENSIVVARHGLEFLVAWEMHTDVLQETSYSEEDLSSYSSVYYLEGIGGMGWPMGGNPPTGMKPPTDMKLPIGMKPPAGFIPGGLGKGPMGGDMKKVDITGVEVYKNDSFTLKKVR